MATARIPLTQIRLTKAMIGLSKTLSITWTELTDTERKERGMEETLKHRAFNLFIWLYYIMIRTLVRRGLKLLVVITTMLAVLEYNVAGNDFDVPYDPNSRKD